MKKSKRMMRGRNEGFSLVELIIVIAIMAVLVGILTPQFLKHVKSSRIAADITNADRVANAVGAAIADEEIPLDPPAEGATLTVTAADLPNVDAFPPSKVNQSYTWAVTVESTGVTYVELGGFEIWPNPDSANGFRTKNI